VAGKIYPTFKALCKNSNIPVVGTEIKHFKFSAIKRNKETIDLMDISCKCWLHGGTRSDNSMPPLSE
jgi:hypothetical protein